MTTHNICMDSSVHDVDCSQQLIPMVLCMACTACHAAGAVLVLPMHRHALCYPGMRDHCFSSQQHKVEHWVQFCVVGLDLCISAQTGICIHCRVPLHTSPAHNAACCLLHVVWVRSAGPVPWQLALLQQHCAAGFGWMLLAAKLGIGRPVTQPLVEAAACAVLKVLSSTFVVPKLLSSVV